MITQENLDRAAIEAFSALSAMLPSYVGGISHSRAASGVTISLSNPSQPEHPLTVMTDARELTIAFGEMHTHISDHDNSKREVDLIEDAIVMTVRLVTGIDETYSAWKGNRCLGGGMIYSGEKDEDIGSVFSMADRIKVTAWGLNQNREIRR